MASALMRSSSVTPTFSAPGRPTPAPRPCLDRAWTALIDALAPQRPGPPVLLVVHQMVLSALLCRVTDMHLRRYGEHSQRNTAVNLLAWRDGALRLVSANLVEHLPPSPAPRPLPV